MAGCSDHGQDGTVDDGVRIAVSEGTRHGVGAAGHDRLKHSDRPLRTSMCMTHHPRSCESLWRGVTVLTERSVVDRSWIRW
jgi:hypothetical protein